MLYAEIVDRAMRSEEPLTEIREFGDDGRIYSAVNYDPEDEVAWRADIDADHNPDYDSIPSVKFSKCRPTADSEALQQWTPLATGALGGPQELPDWEALFTVFNEALDLYNREGREDDSK